MVDHSQITLNLQRYVEDEVRFKTALSEVQAVAFHLYAPSTEKESEEKAAEGLGEQSEV